MKNAYRPRSCFRFIFALMLGAVYLTFSTTAQTPPPPQSGPPNAQTTPKATPTPVTAKDYIAQGIQLYRKGKFDQAAKKFLAALKLEPTNDEALGYASLTAYQLGNQAQARDLFEKRADLPNQKSTVKLFCTYMAALTRWRQAHEIIAKRGEIKDSKTVYKLTDKELLMANEQISGGLKSIMKALEIKSDYAEALNIENLLNSEAAAIATDESQRKNHLQAAEKQLRQALKLHKGGADDFGAPTWRIGEIGYTDDEQNQLTDPELALLEGGRPVTRTDAIIPIIKIAPAKPKGTGDESPPTGVGATGGAVSVGPGQGALRPSKTETLQVKGGKAKVEVLVSPAGTVVFARILDGPPQTTAAALKAAKKWTFSPPKFDGNPVQVLGVITFNVKPSGGNSKSKSKSAASTNKLGPSKKP